MSRPKGSKNKPAQDTSSFFEAEATPDDAKARRLARKKEEETVSQEAPQDGSIKAARERRLARVKEKEAQTPKKAEKTSQIKGNEAPAAVSEATKESIYYFKENWTVELHNDKYRSFADGKHVFDNPTKPISAKED
jgi:hypothetical protein